MSTRRCAANKYDDYIFKHISLFLNSVRLAEKKLNHINRRCDYFVVKIEKLALIEE